MNRVKKVRVYPSGPNGEGYYYWSVARKKHNKYIRYIEYCTYEQAIQEGRSLAMDHGCELVVDRKQRGIY